MKTDASAPCQTGLNTGMAWSILTEIRTLLSRLADTGEVSAIDLRSIPLTETDRTQLEELLGRGEVSVQLDVLGATEIWETGYAGVWWTRHRGADDKVASEEITITPVPEILRAHPVDIATAANSLAAMLENPNLNEKAGREEGDHV